MWCRNSAWELRAPACSWKSPPPLESPFVLADIALTERVLDNLIGKSIDHTPAGGTISLTLDVDGEQVWVSVRDTGRGIPPTDLPHIFEPFYCSNNTRTAKGHAGLGLSIAKRIVDLQGGEIAATNCSTGGAGFSFTLSLHRSGAGREIGSPAP